MQEKESILVAIHCLVYNHEAYLRDCLDGFVMQKTNFRYVAIVHDDCSTDKSAAILKEYAEKYPDKIQPIIETENQYSKHDGSLLKVVINAINETNAKYIALCDGDDCWVDPLKLQKQVDYMETHPECGLCITDFCFQGGLNVADKSLPGFAEMKVYQPQTFEDHLMSAGYIAPMTWLYRKELYMRNTSDYLEVADPSYAMALDLFATSKVAYLPDMTAVYRCHEGSAANSTSVQGMWNYKRGVFRTQLRYAEKYRVSKELMLNLRLQGYVTYYMLAYEAQDSQFLQEADTFFAESGFRMNTFEQMGKEYVDYKKKFIGVKQSHAYRLGKKLLKPWAFLKRNGKG